ncbi:efflux transporter outer membrane subunit [Chitinolyticbacter albus]|uniref:efflux transporter outer membrane subunit n=1 Tax=Chitinolyticbacter albus TaxID=2961951 RepID=UPI002109DD12|nr:efflux transporter outer membrane subunit [Chitinolyticbacter albus]
MTQPFPQHALLVALLPLFVACAGNPQPQANVAIPATWQNAGAAGTLAEADIYWASFGDTQLDALLSQARASNADLATAVLKLKAASYALDAAGLDRQPDIDVSGRVSSSRNLRRNEALGENYNVSASLSWELDIWGRLADQQDAARWRRDATEADLNGVRVALEANVATLYWQLALNDAQVTLAEQDRETARKTFALVEARYKAGTVSGLDLAQARRALSSSDSALESARLTRGNTARAFNLLFDTPPQQAAVDAPPRLPELEPVVPAGLPSDLLSRRPDLAASSARLAASFKDTEATRKSWLPTFSLTGSVGSTSSTLVDVLSDPVATLGLGLALPFIQWNERELALKVSQNEYEQAVIAHRQTIYTAFAEVEDALAARGQLDGETARLVAQRDDAATAERLTAVRYKAGAVDFSTWLTAQDTLRAAERTLLQHRYQKAANLATLYKALGGAPLVAATPA